jgi:hypothetical protein
MQVEQCRLRTNFAPNCEPGCGRQNSLAFPISKSIPASCIGTWAAIPAGVTKCHRVATPCTTNRGQVTRSFPDHQRARERHSQSVTNCPTGKKVSIYRGEGASCRRRFLRDGLSLRIDEAVANLPVGAECGTSPHRSIASMPRHSGRSARVSWLEQKHSNSIGAAVNLSGPAALLQFARVTSSIPSCPGFLARQCSQWLTL